MKTRIARRLSMAVVAAAGLSAMVAPAAYADNIQQINPLSGTSATNFNISLAPGAACSGSGAAGYSLSSYVVDANLYPDPTVLNYQAGAPVDPKTGVAQDTLFDVTGSAYSSQPASTGGVPAAPQFNWAVYQGNFGNDSTSGALLYGGTWNVGIACVTPAGTTDKIFNSVFNFAPNAGSPNDFAWTAMTASTPEIPFAIGLPLAGLGVLGVGMIISRRRRTSAMTAA